MTPTFRFTSRVQPALGPICRHAQPDEPGAQLISSSNPNVCPAGKPAFRSDC
jgi:hypothetical protein